MEALVIIYFSGAGMTINESVSNRNSFPLHALFVGRELRASRLTGTTLAPEGVFAGGVRPQRPYLAVQRNDTRLTRRTGRAHATAQHFLHDC